MHATIKDYALTALPLKHIYESDVWKPTWPPVKDDRFRPQDVELLLDQAADYLDRGLRDKAVWNDLYEKAFRVGVEISESEKEIADLEFRLSKVGVAKQQYVDQAALLTDPKIYTWAVWAATAGSLAIQIGTTVSPTRDNVATNIRYDKTQSLILERLSSSAALAMAEASEIELVGTKELKQQSLDAKKNAWTASGGALQYLDQLAPLEKRYQHDMDQALARLRAAEDGLQDIFENKTFPLPADNTPVDELFDECLIWVRKVISHLVQLKRRDQQLSTTVSLRGFVKDWAAAMKAGAFQVDLSDMMKSEPYSKCKLIRLRSVGLSVIETGDPDPIDLWRMDAAIVGPQPGPTCLAPNVSARNALRSPEPVGFGLLNNLRPFSKWQINVSKQSAKNRESVKVISDIWLDLNCVLQEA